MAKSKNKKRLSKKQKRDYVANRTGSCPYCGSCDVIGDSYEYALGIVTQQVDCQECRAGWEDTYVLAGIAEIRSPGGALIQG